MSSGIVITGGSSVMQGMVELGEEVFHMPVRLGVPQYSGGLTEVVRNPRYATGLGLLMSAQEQYQRHQIASLGSTSLQQVFDKMKSWFQGNF